MKHFHACRHCGVKNDGHVVWATASDHPANKGKKSLCLACFIAEKDTAKAKRMACKRRHSIVRKEHICQRCIRWLSKNKEKNREYQRVWQAKYRASNLEKARAKQREWSAENREKRAASLKKWRIANREKVIHTNRARRARKRNALVPESSLVTKDWFDSLCVAAGHRCLYCLNGHKKLTADHIIPFARGGKHVRENIVPSCKSCNSKKRTSLISEWRPWIDIPVYGLELASA